MLNPKHIGIVKKYDREAKTTTITAGTRSQSSFQVHDMEKEFCNFDLEKRQEFEAKKMIWNSFYKDLNRPLQELRLELKFLDDGPYRNPDHPVSRALVHVEKLISMIRYPGEEEQKCDNPPTNDT